MPVNDPVSDLIVRIQNAGRVRKELVEIPFSGLKQEIVKVLKGEGYVGKTDPVVRGGRKWIRVNLKYTAEKQPVIQKILRISRPGKRVYANQKDLRNLSRGIEVLVVSTSKGVMSHQKAIQDGHGGEVLLSVV